jgi:hypothetical protein
MDRERDFQHICSHTEDTIVAVSHYLSRPENIPDAVELLTRSRSAVEVIVFEKMKKRGVKFQLRRAGIGSDCIANFVKDNSSVTIETLFKMYSILVKLEAEERQEK